MTLQVTHIFPFCLVKSRLVLFSPGFRQRRGIYSFKEESQEKSFSSGISCRWTSETVIWFKALTHCCVFRSLLIYLFPSIPTDLSHLDSQPDTPMSVESANSEASKLRLKIKVSVVSSPLNLLVRGSLHKFCCSKLTFFFWLDWRWRKRRRKWRWGSNKTRPRWRPCRAQKTQEKEKEAQKQRRPGEKETKYQ